VVFALGWQVHFWQRRELRPVLGAVTLSASLRMGAELGILFHPGFGFLQQPLLCFRNAGESLPLSFLGSLWRLFLIPSFWSGAQAMQYGVTVLLKPNTKLRLY